MEDVTSVRFDLTLDEPIVLLRVGARSGFRSQRRVLPSMSVKRNVIVARSPDDAVAPWNAHTTTRADMNRGGTGE